MSTVTESDIKELKDFITNQFNILQRGQEQVLAQVNSLSKQVNNLEIGQARIEEKLNSEIKRIDERLDVMNNSFQKIPELAEKVGELKNWKQAGLIILTAFVSSIFTGSIGGVIGYLIRGSRP